MIIRELMLGPRRFTDVLEGLPGIGPNLLAIARCLAILAPAQSESPEPSRP